ncbi:MAG: imidazole glycerol phosphate synthase subunit HisH [Proteobacteria bacterium]|nr:imidazole glycerol phosphate synthase subunit HisH [Pseudomonadota bacterium]
MITIVDYNMGNSGSIRNMLKKLGFDSQITSDPRRVAAAGKLILPGVGAFDAGMENLERGGLIPVLNERVLAARIPVLGICLGMHLMSRSSAEGERQGLGWIDAEAVRFHPGGNALKVPHMGWNGVTAMRSETLVQDLPVDSRFYFVHSYFIRCRREADVLLTTSYGGVFHSAFQCDNVWGVQFHPEKSHKFGMRLLKNFAERC